MSHDANHQYEPFAHPGSNERRRCPRVSVNSSAVAVFSGAPSGQDVTYIELRDMSAQGLGAVSPIPVAPGTPFSVVPSGSACPRCVGTVARCEPSDGLYKLGLALAARRVA